MSRNCTLVDHAPSRAERGLAGTLIVGGNPNLEIYTPTPAGEPAGE